MQPMMVINLGDPLPDLAAVIIARWAWRYGSELAPLGVADRGGARREPVARGRGG
jgi:hypothetical protein